MIRNNNKYGLLSCIENSWFFMVNPVVNGKKGDGVLSISKVVDKDHLMRELFKCIELSKNDPQTGIYVPKIAAKKPPNNSSGRGGDTNNRSRSCSPHNDRNRACKQKQSYMNPPRRNHQTNNVTL